MKSMPTLLRAENYRVLAYAGDHPPPHVHVKLSDGRDCTVDLVSFKIVRRIVEREVREAMAWIRSNQSVLLGEWKRNNP